MTADAANARHILSELFWPNDSDFHLSGGVASAPVQLHSWYSGDS